MRETNSNKLDIGVYDHWSLDIKQDTWFTASAFEAVFETISKKPKWIKVISDNGSHYHNSELMAIVSYWHTWYDIEVWSWSFLEPGRDENNATKGLSETSLANLEPNCNNDSEGHEKNQRKKSKIKIIKGISKLFYWKWPCQNQYDRYICARPLLHFGVWNNFSPSHVAKLWNMPLHQPQSSISQYTTPETQWTMSIAVESDLIENDKNASNI
ncbi:hypothetical protein C1645_839906 [Glomus cerebriforme]|uniref:Uncharacterized protein n=1 Tax=Glomus cerebriforme TaxID=658196 RepID=A0A397SAQ5_9GLOM|nr:hypothetical protein C1645_839906 [Glomus cerebriforme]